MSSQVEDGIMAATLTYQHHDREKRPRPVVRIRTPSRVLYVYSIYLRCDAGVLSRWTCRNSNTACKCGRWARRAPSASASIRAGPRRRPLHPSSMSSARSSTPCHASKSVHARIRTIRSSDQVPEMPKGFLGATGPQPTRVRRCASAFRSVYLRC